MRAEEFSNLCAIQLKLRTYRYLGGALKILYVTSRKIQRQPSSMIQKTISADHENGELQSICK